MKEPAPEIVLISEKIDVNQLAQLVIRSFTDMVKFVVDLEIEDPAARDRVRELTYRLIGRGESVA